MGDRPLNGQLEVLAEHLPFDVWVRDRDDLCIYANPAAQRNWPGLLGSTPDGGGFPPDVVATWKANNARARAGEVVVGDVTYGEPPAQRVVRNVIAAVTRDGVVVGTVGVNVDITAEREARQQLQRADRLASLGTLAASLAHEIGNPTTALLLGLGLLERELVKVPDQAHRGRMLALVADAVDGTRSIARLVLDLGRLARPEEDVLEAVALDEVARSAISLVRASVAQSAQLELAIEATPPIAGNAVRLAQVFVNLLLNAAKAVRLSGRRGIVRCRTGALTPTGAFFEIEDEGPGIAIEVRARLFGPFQSGWEGGTGLGLLVCKQIVDAHGGTITATDREGGGTIFRVELPRPAPSE